MANSCSRLIQVCVMVLVEIAASGCGATPSIVRRTSTAASPGRILEGVDAQAVLVNDDGVYWLDNHGRVFRADKSGDSRLELAQVPEEHKRLAVSDSHVYWIAFNPGRTHQGKLARVSTRGGDVEHLATLVAPSGLVVDGSVAYVAVTGEIVAVESGRVRRLVAEHAYRLAADERHLYYTTLDEGASILARIPKAGGARELVHRFQDGWNTLGRKIVVGNDAVYVPGGTRTQVGVLRVPIDGSTREMIVLGQAPEGITVDDSALFFTGNRTYRRDHASGRIVALGAQACAPRSLALDATAVYTAGNRMIECPLVTFPRESAYADVVAVVSRWPQIASVRGDDATVFEGAGGHRIFRVQLSDGTVSELMEAPTEIEDVILLGNTRFWLADGELHHDAASQGPVLHGVVSVAGNAQRAFAATEDTVYALSPDGVPRQLLRSERPLRRLATDGRHLYVLDGNEEAAHLRRFDPNGRNGTVLVSGFIHDFVVENERVLWIERTHHRGILGGGYYSGDIRTLDPNGDTSRLAAGLTDPASVLVHRGEVLWQSTGGGLYRLDGTLVEGHARNVGSSRSGLIYADPVDGMILRIP